MEERLRFVARLLDGERMSDVCRQFGISRKTGYKIFDRYRQEGVEALTDRSRRPVRYANQLPEQVERLIVGLKRDKPHWGARKIRELLLRKLAGDVRVPARSTVHAVLDRHGLVRSTSPPSWPDRGSASRRSTTAFGSSASCTMIWDISTWSRGPCKPSTPRSARGCHPCLRYVLSPMSPGRTRGFWRRRRDSNPRPQPWQG